MIGIRNTGVYIPQQRIDNLEKAEKFDVSNNFIEDKIGVVKVARKETIQSTSDLCVEAYENLLEKEAGLLSGEIDFLCVCTQNGDYQLPQTSSVVQGKLALPYTCASFDISLGCSGYPYALHIAKSFMEMNELKNGLLFTCDPYSDIIDRDDKNTDLIFGDGATVTWLTTKPALCIEKGVFATEGEKHDQIIKRKDDWFHMNGRGVFEFVMRRVPESLNSCLQKNNLEKKEIDLFLLHQASQYLIKNLIKRARLNPDKVPIMLKDFGNTVSSSIPIILNEYISNPEKEIFLLSGFGVGLSVASTVIRRV